MKHAQLLVFQTLFQIIVAFSEPYFYRNHTKCEYKYWNIEFSSSSFITIPCLSFLKNKFKKADVDNSKSLSFSEVQVLCRNLNIEISTEEMQAAFHQAIKARKSLSALTEDEFLDFYYELMKQSPIDEIFDKYSKVDKVKQ